MLIFTFSFIALPEKLFQGLHGSAKIGKWRYGCILAGRPNFHATINGVILLDRPERTREGCEKIVQAVREYYTAVFKNCANSSLHLCTNG